MGLRVRTSKAEGGLGEVKLGGNYRPDHVPLPQPRTALERCGVSHRSAALRLSKLMPLSTLSGCLLQVDCTSQRTAALPLDARMMMMVDDKQERVVLTWSCGR
jgi:hypothetical protein